MISGLSGRLATLLSVAAVLVVVLVGWLLLVSPQRGKAAELSGQIDGTQAGIESTQAYVSNPATRQSIHELAHLRKVLPDDSKMSQILRQLSVAASASRVSVTSITPQPATPASGARALPITVAVEGHYFGISKFLHILRTQAVVRGATVHGSGRLFSIDGIQFGTSGSSGSAGGNTSNTASSSSSGGNGTITASVSLNAFVFGPGAAAVAPTDPTTSGGATTTTTTSTAAAPAPSP